MLGKVGVLLLVLVFGTVINHGSVFVDNNHYHIVTIFPSNNLLTKALSSNKFVVGFNSYNKGYIILEFNVSRGKYVLKYNVSKVTFDNPVKLNIYLKEGGKWVLLKRDVASLGWHVVPIPYSVHAGGKIVVKFESCGSVKKGAGASFIDCIKLVPTKSASFIDLKTMQFYIGGNWYPLAVLVLVVLTTLFGTCLLSANTKLGLITGASLSALLLSLTLLGGNVYVFYYVYPSAFSLIVSALVYSIIAAVTVSNLVNKLGKHTQH